MLETAKESVLQLEPTGDCFAVSQFCCFPAITLQIQTHSSLVSPSKNKTTDEGIEEKHFSNLWGLEVLDLGGLRVTPFLLKHI